MTMILSGFSNSLIINILRKNAEIRLKRRIFLFYWDDVPFVKRLLNGSFFVKGLYKIFPLISCEIHSEVFLIVA